MEKLHSFLLLIVAIILVVPQTSNAIPAFARKYGFNCNMCHTGYPKLNDWGQRFRDNGYQIPGQEGGESSVFDSGIPAAIRTTAGYSLYKSNSNTTLGFNIYGLDLLAAGMMHKNISFLFVYTPRIDEPAADYTGSKNGKNPVQLAAIESANIVFSNIIQDALNLRIGRFEPSYELFSSRRLYYILQPYEIYSSTLTNNAYNFGSNQIGVEATGRLPESIKYGLGFLNGTGSDPDNNVNKDIYLNISKTFGKGEGQSAGQRIGLFGYYGWQPTSFTGSIVAPTGETNGKDNKPFYRFGGSISLNWNSFNLQTLFMHGVDDKLFNTADPTKDYEYNGGLVQLDWAGIFDNRLVASALFSWVAPPSYDDAKKINAFSALVRYYLGGWYAVNVGLHAEYTYRIVGTNNQIKDHLFTMLIDFDF
jgi:hypothetical protein